MRTIIKEHIALRDIGIGIAILVFISAVCFAAGFSYIIPLILLLFSMHMYFIRKASHRIFLHVGFLLALIVFMAHAVTYYAQLSPYYIPVAAGAILTMLLFNDLELVFLMSVLTAVLITIIFGGNLSMALIFLIGNLTAAYSVREARSRATMINAGLYIAVMQAFAALLLQLADRASLLNGFWSELVKPLMVNGFLSSFLAISTLKIFEGLFGVVTNFTLLELSDFNQPLLKRMILEAPGTYHHSLIVGNMAETAADAIGAESLLTRVGAYYHDIGKLERPEYFTENQLVGGNKHDNIEASVSRLVIINHVKRGLEMARKYKINPKIAEFIPQHHGTSMTHYFYQKALEVAEDPSTVKEEDFRYPGPKPQTKETAIVMLADSVEAATRALEEPNPQKIEDVVRKIINNKFIDGQLDECDLTLREIELIATTFIRVLSAMYHSRIRYPEKNGEKTNS